MGNDSMTYFHRFSDAIEKAAKIPTKRMSDSQALLVTLEDRPISARAIFDAGFEAGKLAAAVQSDTTKETK